LALLALAESRLHIRFAYEFWHRLAGIAVPQWYIGGGARLGFLRAMGSFTHPITLGVYFGTATLLLLGWKHLVPGRRWLTAAAVAASVTGALASLSRGPLLALVIGYGFAKAVTKLRLRTVVEGTALAIVAISPLLIDAVRELVASVNTDLAQTGNVENTAHYRFALFVVYLDEIAHVGWWGDLSVVGRKFEAAWSLDNAYLFLLVVGGWVGGGIFLVMTGYVLWCGTRSVGASSGRERALRASALGAFLAMAVSMLDVWFAPDYAAFFFIVAALVVNQSSPEWEARAAQGRAPPASPPPAVDETDADADLPLARALRGRPTRGGGRAASARVRLPTRR
jgi:hypothetical protein